ncbi:Na(+) H(+) antiporter subunit F [Micrococcus lylae]|uniref:Na(+) H(+) antiporter subunit F n=1 Tax=Micrococcus lylae TaxID=1273 RepID=A0A1R4JZN4_9MICC|nr:monovalent cation/H+ antiporter complex subunit F [Micrococcus lylae]SJN37374.1 Na(+) H(+) antiporter subunit F [Micrococcus lylae]
MSTPLFVAAVVAGLLLAVGAVGAILRIVRGPSLLDRAIGSDVLLVVLSGALILEMAVNRHTNTIVLVVLASMVGFVGSVTLARFVEDNRPDHAQEAGAQMRPDPSTADHAPRTPSAVKEDPRG